MRCVDVDRAEAILGAGGAAAPVIYVIDLPGHPFDVAGAARGLAVNVMRVSVRSWDDSLTPWPAPGLRKGEKDFGGRAAETLAELTRAAIPALEEHHALVPVRRAICGYSLGGLFSLYAFTSEPRFSACACLSGSLWYPGWIDHLREREFPGACRYAYFSLGKKECKAGPRIMRSVQDNTEACAQICRERGCAVDCVLGPGNHMQHHTERLAAGLAALDAFLTVVD